MRYYQHRTTPFLNQFPRFFICNWSSTSKPVVITLRSASIFRMYTHMEYLQRCFNQSTHWNEDNIYANLTATSQALLDFNIPSGGRIDVSNQATDHLASSMSLLNLGTINGSLAYLFSSSPLKNTMGTRNISLQDAIAGFRIIEPYDSGPQTNNRNENHSKRSSLLYGRMYFPGTALEAMLIKRLTANTQILIKCINNPHLRKSGTMIVYLQENTPRFSREYIYSTNEALFGFRCLYNFGNPNKISPNLIPKFDNSVVSVGAEFWYAALGMSPGLSTAMRYSTRSTSTGKPLTMTLACNPILGHVSSTYNVKTSASSTVCSKYDFNWFSYASNLSVGFELYNFSKPSHIFAHSYEQRRSPSIHHDRLAPTSDPLVLGSATNNSVLYAFTEKPVPFINPIQNLNDYYHINPNLLHKSMAEEDPQGHSVMEAFLNLVNKSNFSSVLKGSASLSDRMVKFLWVGRCKDFLVSAGIKVNMNEATQIPEINKFGVTFSYAC